MASALNRCGVRVERRVRQSTMNECVEVFDDEEEDDGLWFDVMEVGHMPLLDDL